jgi:hypothetical protein
VLVVAKLDRHLGRAMGAPRHGERIPAALAVKKARDRQPWGPLTSRTSA